MNRKQLPLSSGPKIPPQGAVGDEVGYMLGWARNFQNVAPQKQNAICKPRAQYAKHNCTLKLFKEHCAATVNAKNASFHKKFLPAKVASATF